MFESCEDEVFVDAGAYNGDTAVEFSDWAKGNYKKIYAMEPNHEMKDAIIQRLQENGVDRVEIVNCAAWDKKETIYFDVEKDPSGSKVCDDSECVVQGLDIDTMVGSDKVTFIKMDIEGSELNALIGARKTIEKYHPRLAVCVYHKPMDLADLGNYILDIYPDYKLYLRHYSADMQEMVLYAIP